MRCQVIQAHYLFSFVLALTLPFTLFTEIRSCNILYWFSESSAILTASLMKNEIGELIELWTYLNRLLVLKEYFAMCMRSSACFKTGSNTIVGTLFPSADEMARPVKVFVTEYYRRRMLGIPSLCLSTILCNYVNQSESNLLTNLPDESSGPTKLNILELAKVRLLKLDNRKNSFCYI